MTPGVEVPFNEDTEPRTDFGKLDEGGVYTARVYDFEEGEFTTSHELYVGWLIEVNDQVDHWRRLPRNAYRTHTAGKNVGNLRSLLHATGVMPVTQQRLMGKAYINYGDLVGKEFQVKITYISMDKVTESEYPRVKSVFPVPKSIADAALTDLPF